MRAILRDAGPRFLQHCHAGEIRGRAAGTPNQWLLEAPPSPPSLITASLIELLSSWSLCLCLCAPVAFPARHRAHFSPPQTIETRFEALKIDGIGGNGRPVALPYPSAQKHPEKTPEKKKSQHGKTYRSSAWLPQSRQLRPPQGPAGGEEMMQISRLASPLPSSSRSLMNNPGIDE